MIFQNKIFVILIRRFLLFLKHSFSIGRDKFKMRGILVIINNEILYGFVVSIAS